MSEPAGIYPNTKFSPPYLRANVVHRHRLLESLTLLPHTRLALISSPAGYGKTTLLACWREVLLKRGDVVGWIGLDEADNDLGSFLTAVSRALKEALGSALSPAVEKQAFHDLELLVLSGAKRPEAVLDQLVNVLTGLCCTCVMFLDDYHVISHPAIHHAVAHLLNRAPPSLKLAIGSRSDPPLPLARLRARGELVELRMADLCFSAEEVDGFVAHTLQLPLSADEVQLLAKRTEGWAAGLQLIGLSLRNWPDWAHSLLKSEGGLQQVSSYLAEEVFQKLPAYIRSFLLQTSILEELNAELCGSVWIDQEEYVKVGATDAGAVLSWLDINNLFVIPLDPFGKRYRYHPLFAEYLRQTLKHMQPELIPALHLKASQWYWQQGVADSYSQVVAIRHSLKCDDLDWFVHLVEQSAISMMARSELGMVHDWLARIPSAIYHSNPYLAMACAWNQMLLGKLEQVEPYLQMAETGLRGLLLEWKVDILGHPFTSRTVQIHIDGLRAMLARARLDWTTSVRLSEQVLSELPGDMQMLRSVLVLNLGQIYKDQYEVEKGHRILSQAVVFGQASGNLYVKLISLVLLGQLSLLQGRMDESRAYYTQALQVGYDSNGRLALPAVCYAEAWLGDWHRWQGQLDQASERLEKAVQIAELFGQSAILFDVYLNMAQLCLNRGEASAALDWVEKANQLPLKGIQATGPWIEAQLKLIQLVLGKVEEALSWAETVVSQGCPAPVTRFSERRTLVAVQIYLKAAEQGGRDPNQLRDCLEMIQYLSREADAGGRLSSLVEILILQAGLLEALGQASEARHSMEAAHCLADPVGWVQPFLDLPPRIDFRDEAMEASPELLTGREMELLQLVAEGATNQEIADRLFITVGTVKSHLNHIFNKLGARHRAEALSQARKLGLV